MASEVEVGSVWYLISQPWIKKWKNHVHFDPQNINPDPKQRPYPGKIDCADIIDDSEIPLVLT